MSLLQLQEPISSRPAGLVFFAAGFRPFFLFTGLYALVGLPLWLMIHGGHVVPDFPFAPVLWHAHEMVFGFAGAAIAGFLLTAIPNWTGCRPVAGPWLMVLFGIWGTGRLAFLAAGLLPPWLVAFVDLPFFPLLGWLVAKPLLAARKWRNIAFLPILALLCLANLAVHLTLRLEGIYAGLTLVLLMITIVAGRIIPSFTQNWLRMGGGTGDLKAPRWIEKGGAVVSVIMALGLYIVVPGSPATSVALLIAAVIHAIRLGHWGGARSLGNPLLWVLHLGYLWLVLGLALLGIAGFGVLPVSAALHALTAGSVATMIMAVMSRAALGHSGRPLTVSHWMVAAYVLLGLGTALRVFSPLAGAADLALAHAGGMVWALAWLLFVCVYFPILTRPRADGRPG